MLIYGITPNNEKYLRSCMFKDKDGDMLNRSNYYQMFKNNEIPPENTELLDNELVVIKESVDLKTVRFRYKWKVKNENGEYEVFTKNVCCPYYSDFARTNGYGEYHFSYPEVPDFMHMEELELIVSAEINSWNHEIKETLMFYRQNDMSDWVYKYLDSELNMDKLNKGDLLIEIFCNYKMINVNGCRLNGEKLDSRTIEIEPCMPDPDEEPRPFYSPKELFFNNSLKNYYETKDIDMNDFNRVFIITKGAGKEIDFMRNNEFSLIDRHFNNCLNLHYGDNVVICGEPCTGKTDMALFLAANACCADRSVLYVSIETNPIMMKKKLDMTFKCRLHMNDEEISLNTKKMYFHKPESLEPNMINIINNAKNKKIDVLIIDGLFPMDIIYASELTKSLCDNHGMLCVLTTQDYNLDLNSTAFNKKLKLKRGEKDEGLLPVNCEIVTKEFFNIYYNENEGWWTR